MSNGAEVGVHELNSIYRSCRKSDRKREGQLLFLIAHISYNARYAKLREVKNAHFPDFWRSSLSWLVFVVGSVVLHSLHFLSCLSWFVVFFVSHLLIVPDRFVFNLFYSSKHLCACFITFHAAFYDLQFAAVVVHLFLCGHYFVRFYQIVSMDVPICIDADCL